MALCVKGLSRKPKKCESKQNRGICHRDLMCVMLVCAHAHVFTCSHVCVRTCMYMYMWGGGGEWSEDSFQKSLLPHAGPGDRTQVIRH